MSSHLRWHTWDIVRAVYQSISDLVLGIGCPIGGINCIHFMQHLYEILASVCVQVHAGYSSRYGYHDQQYLLRSIILVEYVISLSTRTRSSNDIYRLSHW